ncbi:hypothetical protein NP233_g11677 [Leucocoprinus birnbaumii]|uniref:Uncharacterized protein n=1 Tax=Leucocoprinus birnbaumii TaxID=56174 RepID=A0AAD5VGB8_9AGAR|nr:hypothetical protein NP233_g11677 [Leucocoprinus birnbaumii]
MPPAPPHNPTPAPLCDLLPSPEPSTPPTTFLDTEPNEYGVFRRYTRFPRVDPVDAQSLDDLCDTHTISTAPRTQSRRWWSGLGTASDTVNDKFFAPFLNATVYQLMDWYYNGSTTKSLADLDALVQNVLLADDFNKEDLTNFSATREGKRMDKARASEQHNPEMFTEEKGWKTTSVTLKVPVKGSVLESEDDALVYEIDGVQYRKLTDVIESAFQDQSARAFHYMPFTLFRQQDDRPPERIITELYNADAFIEEHAKLQQENHRVQVDGVYIETAIAAIMLWSDSTHLAQFGSASLWPIYCYFGNQSKYEHARPSSFTAHHLAYIPSLPKAFQDWYHGLFENISAASVALTHMRCELMHAIWYGITRLLFPRFFTYSADYPEKARKWIYQKGRSITSTAVEHLLKLLSMVATHNAFSEVLSKFGFDYHQMFVPDLLHEFELGVAIQELNQRYRAIPLFSRDTIRRFSENASAMNKLAGHDFEDLLQCSIPVLEGLLPHTHNDSKHSDDMAVREFIPKLKDHLLSRLSSSKVHTDEERSNLVISANWIYQHKYIRIYYTTYNMRQAQDSINPRTRSDIMMLADSEDSGHPYVYARVLGIFHAEIKQWDPHSRGAIQQTITFLFVDHDMFMRYRGGGVGHIIFSPEVGEVVADAEEDEVITIDGDEGTLEDNGSDADEDYGYKQSQGADSDDEELADEDEGLVEDGEDGYDDNKAEYYSYGSSAPLVLLMLYDVPFLALRVEQEPGDLSAFTYPELPKLPALMYSDDEEEEEDEYEGLEWQSDGEYDDYNMDFQAFEDTVFPLSPDQWGTITDRVDDSNHGSNDIESIRHEANDSEDDQDVDGNQDVDAAEVLKATQNRVQVECLLINDGHGLKPACSLCYSEKHRRSRAGCIISESEESDAHYASAIKETKKAEQDPWVPFASRMDWDIAKWAKLRNIGSTDLSKLLAIEGLCDALGLSYKNTRELNNIVDNLPTIPKFQERKVVINGKTIIFHSQDIIACLEDLWRDPELMDDLILEPEQQWADKERTSQLYHEMNTGDWWWTTQAEVEKATGDQHATVVPIILSSDKTQLTMFRNKQAYPSPGASPTRLPPNNQARTHIK